MARQLHVAQVPFYLPLARRSVRIRNRPTTSYSPLFTSYVFLLANPQERMNTIASSRVVASIKVSDQERFARDLRQVHRLINSGVSLAAEERMIPGALVEIQCGPLAGLRGKIIEAAPRSRFVVEVEFIRRGVSVVLDGHSLMPASD